jgi:collagenase-like PrtC family protease
MSRSLTDSRLAPEAQRIESLIRREGVQGARAWVVRILEIYRQAIDNPASHASLPEYRPLFERSIAAFEHWLVTTSER